MDYRQLGLESYGYKCEICGHSLVEVHHISYQEQWEMEKKLREATKQKRNITKLLEEAKEKGFLQWDDNQLSKDNRSTNLSVLCGNCHTLIHQLDVGMNIIKVLDRRK